jgi:transcriptional regulator with XRE-family HTH domain
VVSYGYYRNSDCRSQANGRYLYRHSESKIADNAQTMQTPGQRIKSAYERAGYNQGEFAKLVGCSQSTLSEIETGESKLPSAKVLLKMTEVLCKSARWIVYGEDGDVQTPTKEEQQMLTAFRNLPLDAQRSLAETIKTLASTNKP